MQSLGASQSSRKSWRTFTPKSHWTKPSKGQVFVVCVGGGGGGGSGRCRSSSQRSRPRSRKKRGLDVSERAALLVAAEYAVGSNWAFRIVERKKPRSPYVAVLEVRWSGRVDAARKGVRKSGMGRRRVIRAARKWR